MKVTLDKSICFLFPEGMNTSMSDEGSGSSITQNEEQFAFLGRMENIKVFSLLLKAISFKVHLFIFGCMYFGSLKYYQYRRWVAKLAVRLLATAALWVRIQTSLKKMGYVDKKPKMYKKVFIVGISFYQ
jgi:hypothetical protein